MDKQEITAQEIEEVEKSYLSHLTVTPNHYTFISLYQVLQQLYSQQEYSLVSGICQAIRTRFDD